MRPCPCNLGKAHTTKWGSMRFCKNFLSIQSLKGRMDHLKTINTCFKCLQLNHKARVCKAKLKCPYCYQVGKTNTKHNTAYVRIWTIRNSQMQPERNQPTMRQNQTSQKNKDLQPALTTFSDQLQQERKYMPLIATL